jgi:hypothetical protein
MLDRIAGWARGQIDRALVDGGLADTKLDRLILTPIDTIAYRYLMRSI